MAITAAVPVPMSVPTPAPTAMPISMRGRSGTYDGTLHRFLPPDIDVAAHWATLVTPYVSTVKIGLELYLRYGPAVVATVRGGRPRGVR